MSRQALVTVGSILLAAVFFSVPLIIKYHVYRPYQQKVAPGDVVPVSLARVSTFWCQDVDLQSESFFRAFMFEDWPQVNVNDTVRTTSKLDLRLNNDEQEFWGFHLLLGSFVEVAGCSQMPRVGVTMLKGNENLQLCLKEHWRRKQAEKDSEEDSLSESESDEGTSSISSSQGVVGNDSTALHVCSSALSHAPLDVSYSCQRERAFGHALSETVSETDYYYFVFSSNTYLDLIRNNVSLEFTIDRTTYHYDESSGNCSSGQSCRLSLPMGHSGPVVVATETTNGSKVRAETLQISCRPREAVFFIFYAAFLITIFVCAFN